MPRPSEAVVLIESLRVQYGNHQVLTGVDLRLEPGTILALLGPNGAGKTTTLEVLGGFRRRSSGRVRVLGQDPEKADEAWRARLGTVLQSWHDHRRWRVRELLHHLGRHYAAYGSADRTRPLSADALLEHLGLVDQASTTVGHLSGGQRRRLDVAIGLVGNPELLFLDEPTVGFDPQARHDFHQLIRSISETTSTAMILTTHDLAEAEHLAHDIAVLLDGRIVAQGTPAQLTARLAPEKIISYRQGSEVLRRSVPTTGTERAVRDVLQGSTDITELEVSRPRLEEAYLRLIAAAGPHRSRSSADRAAEERRR